MLRFPIKDMMRLPDAGRPCGQDLKSGVAVLAPPPGFQFIEGTRIGTRRIVGDLAPADGVVGADKYNQGAEFVLPMKASKPGLGELCRSLPKLYETQFTPLRELGSGAFGQVLLARVDASGGLVAVKYPAVDQQHTLEHEIFINSKLNHDNIVRMVGVVPDDNYGGPLATSGMAMEFCSGGTLGDWLDFARTKNRPPLPLLTRLQFAEKVCLAVEHMHGAGVCHLDLKPQNLLLPSADLEHRPDVKVGDFGLAQVISDTFMPGRYRGTLPYMAPELVRNRRTCAAPELDIWSMGVIFKELVTLEAPCCSMTGPEVKVALRTGQLHAGVTSCEFEWAELIAMCLQYDPTQRPSATQLLRHIANLIAREASREMSWARALGRTPSHSGSSLDSPAFAANSKSLQPLPALPDCLGIGDEIESDSSSQLKEEPALAAKFAGGPADAYGLPDSLGIGDAASSMEDEITAVYTSSWLSPNDAPWFAPREVYEMMVSRALSLPGSGVLDGPPSCQPESVHGRTLVPWSNPMGIWAN